MVFSKNAQQHIQNFCDCKLVEINRLLTIYSDNSGGVHAIADHHHYHSDVQQYFVETTPDLTAQLIPPTPPPRRIVARLGCLTSVPSTDESPKNGSNDESDGAGSAITTATISTTAGPINCNLVAANANNDNDDNDEEQQKLLNQLRSSIVEPPVRHRRNRRKCQSLTHAVNNTNSVRIRRIASGLRLAHSQAMAVAGFLPDSFEMQPIAYFDNAPSSKNVQSPSQSTSSSPPPPPPDQQRSSSTTLPSAYFRRMHSISESSTATTTTTTSLSILNRFGGGGGSNQQLNQQRASFHGRGQAPYFNVFYVFSFIKKNMENQSKKKNCDQFQQ